MIFNNEGVKGEIAFYILGKLLSLISLLSLVIVSYTLFSKSTLYMEVSLKLKLLLITIIILSYIMYGNKLKILYGVAVLPIITILYYLLMLSSNFIFNVVASFVIFILSCGLYYNSKHPITPLCYRLPMFPPYFVFQYNLLSLLSLTMEFDIIERAFLAIGIASLLYKLSFHIKDPIYNLWAFCFQKLTENISMDKILLSKPDYLLKKYTRHYLNKTVILRISPKVISRIIYKKRLEVLTSLINVLNVLANINMEAYIPVIGKASKNFIKQILHIERSILKIFRTVSKHLEHVQKSVEHSLTLSSFLIGLMILIIVLIYLILMYLT